MSVKAYQYQIPLSIALAMTLSFLATGDDVTFAAPWPQDNIGGFFGLFFGLPSPPNHPNYYHRQSQYANSYRTLCVRTCDGYYFPISYATNRGRFKTDAAVCKSMYPPGEAALYVHHTTGEDATQAVSLTGEPLGKLSFAFAYRSSYDHACAMLFHSGSGARISFTKRPVPESVVAASLMMAVVLPRRAKPSKLPSAAAAEMPANLDPSVRSGDGSGDGHVTAEGVRTVGPAYEPSRFASTGGQPPKLAKPDMPDAPAMSTDEPPVAASILPNPLDFFHKSTPPPQPDAEPVD
jgi:Protein of unknown function (DUF2865)